MSRKVTTIREPITRQPSDVDAKVVKGGVAAVIVGAVVTALAGFYDLDLDESTVAALSSTLVAVAYAGVAYATRSFRRKRIDEDAGPNVPYQTDAGQSVIQLVVGVLVILILVFVLLRLV